MDDLVRPVWLGNDGCAIEPWSDSMGWAFGRLEPAIARSDAIFQSRPDNTGCLVNALRFQGSF